MRIDKRSTGTLLLLFQNWVVKIMLNIGSIKEGLEEKIKVNKIINDRHFNSYLAPKIYLFVMSIMRRMLSYDPVNQNELILNYFNVAFRETNGQPGSSLKDLLDFEFLSDFIERIGCEYSEKWGKYLEQETMGCASIHGDFHSENILVKDNQLYFIDWSRFRENSSRYFDLINYYVFLNKDKGQSWMEFWLTGHKEMQNSMKIYNIEIDRKIWLNYAIWKTADEISALKLRNSLNNQKIQKYKNFILELSKLIDGK